MTFVTGDIHGKLDNIVRFCERMNLSQKDTVVILGDVGANYYLNRKDALFKEDASKLHCTLLCIHGNHEIRPQNLRSYKKTLWNGGWVYYEPEYPNILFAVDGEIFTLNGLRCMAIGGAYSVDKYYRLERGFGWWEDEQPSVEIKQYVEKQLSEHKIDCILSHTCPARYIPAEAFLSCIDQNTVDNSTEQWLDIIEQNTNYTAWYCGHWHINKRIDKMHFLFNCFETLGGVPPTFDKSLS